MKKTGMDTGIAAEQQEYSIQNMPVVRAPEQSYGMPMTGSRLPLPVGVSDYRRASTEYYYVDKTLLIRDLLDERAQVSLFTRPRRFGKTLNLDMIRVFFEQTDQDTSIYFRTRNIWRCGEHYQAYQGRFPVIFLSFKDVKCSTWRDTLDFLKQVIRNEFERHIELLGSSRISTYEKSYIDLILRGSANESDYAMALLNLSRMLDEDYGMAPIVLLDEYDTPIQQGHLCGFYSEVIGFMRSLFSGVLKDNPHLTFGVLTGVLRVAKESVFSGLNNLKINSLLDERYSDYFGFTRQEVAEMATYYGCENRLQEIQAWYDGYRFGTQDIYNPWSVVSYFGNAGKPKAFWQATGSNGIIGEILEQADSGMMERLQSLMQGKTVLTHVDTSVVYPQIPEEPNAVFSFLLMAGYLKAVRSNTDYGEDYLCELAIPNREISYVYSKEILSRLKDMIPQNEVVAIRDALYMGDSALLQEKLRDMLEKTISYHDAANEAFYHGFVLGLCALMDSRYHVQSNREAGDGRFDIQMRPMSVNLPGILIEIKAAKEAAPFELKQLAEQALEQIEKKRYVLELRHAGVGSILKYGVAFSGKHVCVDVRENTLTNPSVGKVGTLQR